MKKILIGFFLVVLIIMSQKMSAFSFTKDLTVEEILNKIEDKTEQKTDVTAKVRITHQRAEEGAKVYECVYYRRDQDDSFLIVMSSPEVERGNGYLRMGNNFWLYRRNTRTFQHINRYESIAGTNSRGEDFENKELTELYRPALDEHGMEIISQTMLGKTPVYQFKVEARSWEISYPIAVYWVKKDDFLPLKIQYYSMSGVLMQTSYFLKYCLVKGQYLWIKALFVDEFEQGNKTLVEVVDISYADIDSYIFTKAYLENLSK